MDKTEIMGENISQTQHQRNYGVLRNWFSKWVWNTVCNFDFMRKEYFDKKKNYSIALENKKHVGKPAVIVGAGPSLDKVGHLLKDFKGAVFASESVASTCTYYGHKPEYIGIFDSGVCLEHKFLDNINWKGSKLLTHPAVDPNVLRSWKWEKLYYMMLHLSSVDTSLITEKTTLNEILAIAKDQLYGTDFFEHINPLLFPYVRTMVLNAGCIVNNLVQLANFMGFGPLFLIGTDFGFPENKLRSISYKKKFFGWDKTDKFMSVEEAYKGRNIHVSENGIKTTEEQIEYKKALMSIYAMDKCQLFDCSDGIITELPKLDFKEVVKKNGKGFENKYRNDSEIIRRAKSYLDSREEIKAK